MASRNRGQVKKRGDRKWLVSVYLGTDAQGRRKYRSKMVHGNKADAQRYLTRQLRAVDQNEYVEPSRVTLDAYLDTWLEARRGKIRERTREDYAWALKKYVRPALGHRRLDQLAPEDVERLYSAMGETTSEHKGVGARTIRLTHTILRSALAQAVRWRKLARNPSDGVELPKQERREMRALTPEQAASFREASEAHPLGLLFRFLLVTGCRPSEALALGWDAVDLRAGVVRIVRTLEVRKTGEIRWALVTPKAESQRSLPIPPSLVRDLRAWRLGQPPRELGLVFADDQGLPLDHRRAVRSAFRRILRAARIDPEGFRVYDLRHSTATLLLAAGEPVKVVSERLGHRSSQITMDTYQHVLPGMQERATERLEAILRDTGGGC